MPLTPQQIQTARADISDPDKKLPEIFNALSDPTRCRTFRLLLLMKDQDVNVTDIAHVIGVSMPAISQQLKILESVGLIKRERRGQMIFYKIDNANHIINSLIPIIIHT